VLELSSSGVNVTLDRHNRFGIAMLLVAFGDLPLKEISVTSGPTPGAPSIAMLSGMASDRAFTTLTNSLRRFSSRVTDV